MNKLLFLLVLTCAACNTYTDDDLQSFDKRIQKYMQKNNIDCEPSPSGLYYRIDNPGAERKIQLGDEIKVKYTGKLLNGEIFDEHQKQAISYSVRGLISAWKEILMELGEGGKAYIIAPPHLGYGDYELESIPKNSILIYTIEVVEVK